MNLLNITGLEILCAKGQIPIHSAGICGSFTQSQELFLAGSWLIRWKQHGLCKGPNWGNMDGQPWAVFIPKTEEATEKKEGNQS